VLQRQRKEVAVFVVGNVEKGGMSRLTSPSCFLKQADDLLQEQVGKFLTAFFLYFRF
jgi:hypothetical protein